MSILIDTTIGDKTINLVVKSPSDLVAEVLFIAESIDLAVDSIFEPGLHRNEIIEVTPDCKYLKYIQAKTPAYFWTEKKVNFAISQAFRKSGTFKYDNNLIIFRFFHKYCIHF